MKLKFIQNIIDKLRNKKDIPAISMIPLMTRKIKGIERNKNTISVLILGSSHAEHGYIADIKEFNLGLSHQDLYYSYKLYEKFNSKNIKNIVLFYSIFSCGHQVVKTKSAVVALIYKLLCDIDFQETDIEKDLSKHKDYCKKRINKFIKKYKNDFPYRGNIIERKSQFFTSTGEQRALAHLKNNQRKNNQTKYCLKMAEIAKENNQNFYIVIPPQTKDYKAALTSDKELFKELYSAAKNCDNIKILNLYNEDFSNDYFLDWDHLNFQGAKRLTEKIKKYIL